MRVVAPVMPVVEDSLSAAIGDGMVYMTGFGENVVEKCIKAVKPEE